MLEIIALIFLTKKNGALAIQKGLKSGTWKLYTVLAWIGAEVMGAIFGFIAFGQDNTVVAILFGLLCAVGSYFIVRSILNKKPDVFNDDINRIGVEDLRP